MDFDETTDISPGAQIKVIGVGGAGGNAVNTMIKSSLEGVEFIAANSDVQALKFSLAPKTIQLGKELTKGLGAGADPDVGRDAALEDKHEIAEFISGADMVFITAGMGGGTGTGAAPVISQIARELGALTVGVVTKPFIFEGKRRKRFADSGIERLKDNVDTLITIPNQKLLQIATPDLSMMDAFRLADNVLVNAVRGISDIINVPGTVNVDFADVKTVMSNMGYALMGIGMAAGENRAVEAARQAIRSPLLEDIDIEGATGILINIAASDSVSLIEISEACSIVQDAAHEEANIIFGAAIDENLGDEIRVTVIATGFPMDDEMSTDANVQHQTSVVTPKKSILSPSVTQNKKPAEPLLTPKKKEEEEISPMQSSSQDMIREKKQQQSTTQTTRTDPLIRAGATYQTSDNIDLNANKPEIKTNSMDAKTSGTSEAQTPREPLEDESLEEETLTSSSSALPIEDGDWEELEKYADEPQNQTTAPDSKQGEVESSRNRPLFKERDEDMSMHSLSQSIEKDIDDAISIAENLHKKSGDANDLDEDIDIPAFIRKNMKDIPIS